MSNYVKQVDGSYIEVGSIASNIAGNIVDDTKDFSVLLSAIPPVKCEDYYTSAECLAGGCYWYEGSCHSLPQGVTCADFTTESTCRAQGCHWYDGKCHSKPKDEVEFPWLVILGIAGGAVALLGVVLALRRR